MKTEAIISGTRQVIISAQEGAVFARLYVNNGTTASLENWKGKTVAGAKKWAAKILS